MLRDSIVDSALERKWEAMRQMCVRNRKKKRSRERKQNIMRDQFKRGKAGEKLILEVLKKKFSSVVDNNETNKFSPMDFSDNTAKIDFECKNRSKYTHNQFDVNGYENGLMFGRNKFDYGIKRLKEGYRQIIYWICKDGIFFWELVNPETQNKEFTFSMNSAKVIGQEAKNIVYVKTKYLTKLQ